MNELALFAGAGGGILGGHLLGWRCVCAVEYNAYARSVLLARQNDRTLPPFPVWDDVRTFDGRPWRGIVDVVSGGFPCQDISAAGNGAGIGGERSGLWVEMARIIREVRPRYVFVENSPMLTSRGLGKVLGDLASMGFDAEWGVISAADTGALHKRERIWIVGHTNNYGQATAKECRCAASGGNDSEAGAQQAGEPPGPGEQHAQMADATGERQPGQGEYVNGCDCKAHGERKAGNAFDVRQFREWPIEPRLGRVVDGMANRSDRLKALGNGQVPRVAATAFLELASRFEHE